jgi:peptide/nickel transport system permease protein
VQLGRYLGEVGRGNLGHSFFYNQPVWDVLASRIGPTLLLMGSAMLDVLGSDFIRTARAKGLAERVVMYKHALRNALLPVVTVLGLQFGNVMAGAILVETVFNWPGLGRLAFDSVLRRDYPTILGVLLFSSIVVIVMNILTDLAYRLIDPRIKAA